jgi:hypothetical protein
MKVVLGYMERVLGKRLPDYIYYIVLPIFYTLTDSFNQVSFLVGVSTKVAEIQNTVFLFDNFEDSSDAIIGHLSNNFFTCVNEMDADIARLINGLIDVVNRDNLERFEAWLTPFIYQLGTGFFNIDVACLVFDCFILQNRKHLIYYILTCALVLMK